MIKRTKIGPIGVDCNRGRGCLPLLPSAAATATPTPITRQLLPAATLTRSSCRVSISDRLGGGCQRLIDLQRSISVVTTTQARDSFSLPPESPGAKVAGATTSERTARDAAFCVAHLSTALAQATTRRFKGVCWRHHQAR